MPVCSYHVTYAFQSEYMLYICLNVKELLAGNKRDIWSLGDCNGTRVHNHLVLKRTLNHLAKLTEPTGCGFESRSSHLKVCYLELCLNGDVNGILQKVNYFRKKFQGASGICQGLKFSSTLYISK